MPPNYMQIILFCYTGKMSFELKESDCQDQERRQAQAENDEPPPTLASVRSEVRYLCDVYYVYIFFLIAFLVRVCAYRVKFYIF